MMTRRHGIRKAESAECVLPKKENWLTKAIFRRSAAFSEVVLLRE
jgi:hypothetical protein